MFTELKALVQREMGRGPGMEALSLILPFDQDEGQPAPPAAHYMPKRL